SELHRQFSDFLERSDTTHATNDELLETGVDDAAPGILNVLANDAGKFTHGQARVAQLVELGLHDNLLYMAAVSVDFGNARHGAKLRFDGVFLDLQEFHELCLARGRRVGRARRVIHRVVTHFAET